MGSADLQQGRGFIQTLAVPILAYGSWVLRDLRNQVRQMNGRVIRLEQWKDDVMDGKQGFSVDRCPYLTSK